MKKPLLVVLIGLFCSGLLSNPQAHAQISTNTNPNAEPIFKVAEADEEQGADGAQELSELTSVILRSRLRGNE